MPAYASRISAAGREWNYSRSDVVHMSGVKGDVEIKGHGSDIELEDIAGPVNVDGTYNGTIELRKTCQAAAL